MSLKLSHRLDKIENEIRYMLMLQKCGGSGNEITVTGASPSTSASDSNANKNSIVTKIHSKRQLRTPQSRCSVQTCERYRGSTTKFQQRSNIKLTPAKCNSEVTKPWIDLYKSSDHKGASCCTSAIITKPKQTPIGSCTSDFRQMCKCGISPVMELEIERARRHWLEEEVARLKTQLSAVTQSKSMAITMTKQLKRKYEKIKNSYDETTTKLKTLTKENSVVCRCLEQERQRNITRARGDTTCQPESSNSCICRGAGLETIQERDDRIRALNESVLSLTKSVQDKEHERKKLEADKQKIEIKLQQHKLVTKKLSETNAKLAKSVKSKHESFMALRTKAGRYEKQLEDYKSILKRSHLEIEKMKRDVEKSQQILKEKVPIEDFSEKLKRTMDKERKSSEMIQILNQKLRDVEEKGNKEAEREIKGLRAECKGLQTKLDEAHQTLKDCQAADRRKTETLKKEMATVASNLNKNSEAISEDKEKLKGMIAELQASLQDQQRRLNEVEELRQQQDIVIRSQNEQLISKEEQIRLREQENCIIKEKCLYMDRAVEQLKSSGDMTESTLTQFVDSDKLKELEAKIEELLSLLEKEKQKMGEMEKQIEDQTRQLEFLKSAQADLQKTEDQLGRTSRELERQQEAMHETSVKIKKMQTTKERLQRKMDHLEMMCAKLVVLKDESSGRVIALEGQLEDEKSIRAEVCQRLEDEKNEALDIAKYARRTLIDTVNDYQSHMITQLDVQRVIVDIINTKKKKTKPRCLPKRGYANQAMQAAKTFTGPIDASMTDTTHSSADFLSTRRPESAPQSTGRDQLPEPWREVSIHQHYFRPGTAPMESSGDDTGRQPITSLPEYSTASDDMNRMGYHMGGICLPEIGPMPPMVHEAYPYVYGGYGGYRGMLPPCTVAIPYRYQPCEYELGSHPYEYEYGSNICQQSDPYATLPPYDPHLNHPYTPPQGNGQMIPPFPSYSRKQQVSSVKQRKSKGKKISCVFSRKKR